MIMIDDSAIYHHSLVAVVLDDYVGERWCWWNGRGLESWPSLANVRFLMIMRYERYNSRVEDILSSNRWGMWASWCSHQSALFVSLSQRFQGVTLSPFGTCGSSLNSQILLWQIRHTGKLAFVFPPPELGVTFIVQLRFSGISDHLLVRIIHFFVPLW